MRFLVQIHDLRPVRETFPEGLGDFQRFFECFQVNFSVATPFQGCEPLIRGSQPSYAARESYSCFFSQSGRSAVRK